jgi:hypothetical protein
MADNISYTQGAGTTLATEDRSSVHYPKITGDVAHDAADAGHPIKIGYKALEYKASPTAVAAGDRAAQPCDRNGMPFILCGHPNEETLFRKDTAAQTDAILKAVGAAERFVILGISVLCSNANTVDVQALIEFDDTADVPIQEHPNAPRGGGFIEGGGGGILAIGAAGQDVLWTCTVPTSGSVVVNVRGFLIAV